MAGPRRHALRSTGTGRRRAVVAGVLAAAAVGAAAVFWPGPGGTVAGLRAADISAARPVARGFTPGAETAPGEAPTPFVVHTVQAGETLSAVADHYGISIAAITANNGLSPDAELTAGAGLFVPVAEGLLYTILDAQPSAGDIAARLGLRPEDLRSVAADAWGLAVGRTILVPLSPARLASLDPALDEEARLDPALAARIGAADSAITLREGGLSWPAAGRIAQLFWSGHTGVDIAAPGGAPIWAPADGVVSFEGWTPYGGIAICTTHEHGLESCAYHAAATFVDVGDRVRRGERIGEVGMSGLAAGPHVHWQVRRDGQLVNPLAY
jgi:murein DD-endopeptidase MepM/ murein hydrolase activator NlpD